MGSSQEMSVPDTDPVMGPRSRSRLTPWCHRTKRGVYPDALDDWIAEVGEDYIVDPVEETRRGVAEGTVPAFKDKDAFLQHLTRTALHKSA